MQEKLTSLRAVVRQFRTDQSILAVEELLELGIEEAKNRLLVAGDAATVSRLQGEANGYRKILDVIRNEGFNVDNQKP